MLSGMILIVAALAEELATGLNLCTRREKQRRPGLSLWTGEYRGRTAQFLKLGIGPHRAAAELSAALATLKPNAVLNIGYAGALDPALELGDIVIGTRADLLSSESRGAPLDRLGLEGSWPLCAADELLGKALSCGLRARAGIVLTSRWVMGAPEHKRILFDRFGAAVVDMETAALARVAAAASVPLGCARAVSDRAQDDFLAFLSYDPETGAVRRAARGIAAGGWLRRLHEWRAGSAAARRSLSSLLGRVLEAG